MPTAHDAPLKRVPASTPATSAASILACDKNAVQKELALLHRTVSSLFTFCLG